MIIIQIILPLILIGIIIYFSHYLIERNHSKKENSSLFGLKSNEICSKDSFENSRKEFFNSKSSCLNISSKFYPNISSINIQLIIKCPTNEIFEEILFQFKSFIEIHQCQNIEILPWKSNLKHEQILFQNSNSFRLLIDIKQMKRNLFDYELIVPQSKTDEFNEFLTTKINLNFLKSYEHPSEQIVF